MANERKTEKIVRSHLEKFSEMIHIEEQSSEIQKIDKLLTVLIFLIFMILKIKCN